MESGRRQKGKVKMARKAKTQNSEPRTQNFLVPLCLCGCIFLICGCDEATQKSKLPTSKQDESVLSESTLGRQNTALKAENEELKRQLETLMGIDKPVRIEAVSTILSIELTDRCGIYDKDNDGKKETLVVYLRAVDDMGDCIKASGAVKIELWDLDTKPQDALLKSWQIGPEELKKSWSGSLLTSYYKLKLDAGAIAAGNKQELTVRAEFTDYLTGKILKAQQILNSR
jgi:hypothetical protein